MMKIAKLVGVLATLVFFTVLFTKCNKHKVGDEFVGEWKNNTTTLNVQKKGRGSYEKSDGGKHVEYTGGVKKKGNTLSIGLKKFTINANPTQIPAGNGLSNTYIVLEDDTLFKEPFNKPNSEFCRDGIKNNNETGIDCGGSCKPCETCFDGIRNQNETGIDVGGVCGTCYDGKKNQNETEIDCGGVCESCITNACNTDLGYTDGTYYITKQTIGATGRVKIESDSAVDIQLGRWGSDYLIEFDAATFFSMPINSSRFATIGTNFDKHYYPNRFCTVMFNLSGNICYVEENQKIYFSRLNQDEYNIKFCLLKVAYGTEIHYISANANFKLYYE